MLITVDQRWENHEKTAAAIPKKFISLFMSYTNNSLNLIFEDYSNAYEFLENLVYHKGDKVYVRFNVKNFDAIRKTGSQKIRKGAAHFSGWQHFFRIRKGSSFDIFCKCDSLKFIFEVLEVYKWPQNWVEAALFKTSRHRTQVEGLWEKVIGIFQNVKKNDTNWLLNQIDNMEDGIGKFIGVM